MKFEDAYKRLEEIYKICMSSDMLEVDKMVALQEEAKVCYEICQTTLLKTQAQLSQTDAV